MRTIKFRAWDKETKEMFSDITAYSLLLDTEWSLWDTFGRRIEDAKKSNNGLKVNYKNGILMQYTGLKDKNGKEIYEGDILKWSSWKLGSKSFDGTEHEKKINSVVWDSLGKWVVGDSLYEMGIYDDLEVIGNIYENPELLTNSTKE